MSEQQTGGNAWGDPISDERKAELKMLAGKQREWTAQPEATRGDSVFKGVKLTGADVYWLAKESGRDVAGEVPNLHLEGANLMLARLERANLSGAHLEGVNFFVAHLERAVLSEAHLEGASLFGAHLEGASFFGAHLEGAELSGAAFDKTSHLNEIVLTGVSLDQVTYDNVNLTVVDWGLVPVLGDELRARDAKDKEGKPKDKATRLIQYTSAVRANRVLAVTLRSQGMNEDADRYAYHAQLCQQQVLRLQPRWGQWLFLGLLWLLSGYGYRLWRILAAYGVVVVWFALAYFLLGLVSVPQVSWYEALLASFTDIHGRVGVNTIFPLLSVQQWLAAIESVIGIVIEGVFVAMLVQRFFAR